jgi:50S ribosomal protein L16 3-hydroxylase
MSLNTPLPLLGGLSPAQFMRRHWQKKPLLVRQAMPGVQPPVARAALFGLAARDDVESRLIVHQGQQVDDPAAWRVRQGPLPRRALPPVAQPGWTLLVQGLDLHVPAAHALLQPFGFLPAARLDDLMMSWASPGGGVGPHLDSYDVFLLQVQGRRRWRIGRVKGAAAAAWVESAPLKILQRFEPSDEWLLEPGDMLYLPPRWAHDGVADGECMTCSIGFRVPERGALGAELLQRIAEAAVDEAGDAAPAGSAVSFPVLYRDPDQPATDSPALLPAALQAYAQGAVQRLLADPDAIGRALGEVLTEPKPAVWFEARSNDAPADDAGCVLDAATRMLYDAKCIYINGESYRAGGRDAVLMHRLADRRALSAADCSRLGADARSLLAGWQGSGWVHALAEVSQNKHPPTARQSRKPHTRSP